MKQATQSGVAGATVIENSPSAIPDGILAETVSPEAIRQLFINLLREGNVIRSLAVGESMSPCIQKGDLLVVKPIALEEAGIGEIVAFRRDESHSVLTSHRVVYKGIDGGRPYLMTQGDSNLYRDFPLSPQDVLGKVVGIKRKGQVISLESPFHRLYGYLRARWSLGLWILGVLKRKIGANPGLGRPERERISESEREVDKNQGPQFGGSFGSCDASETLYPGDENHLYKPVQASAQVPKERSAVESFQQPPVPAGRPGDSTPID